MTQKQTAQTTKSAPPPTPPNGTATTATTAMTAPPETQALEIYDFGEDAGQGFENQDMSDHKIPMIAVLQSNSPQVVESRGKVVAGQLFNTVTNEVYDELYAVACLTDHVFLAFVPRDEGGGFKGRYAKDSKTVIDAIARNDGRAIGKLALPQPNDPKTGKPQPTQELIEAFEVYLILHKEHVIDGKKSPEVTGFAVMPFTSTKIKTYKAWNSQIGYFAPTLGGRKFQPKEIPLWAHRIKITTEIETNAKGTFFVPVIAPAEGGDDLIPSLISRRDDPRYVAGKKLHDDVKKGLAKAAYETMTQDPAQDPESSVPF
jgi:hypothetical protein